MPNDQERLDGDKAIGDSMRETQSRAAQFNADAQLDTVKMKLDTQLAEHQRRMYEAASDEMIVRVLDQLGEELYKNETNHGFNDDQRQIIDALLSAPLSSVAVTDESALAYLVSRVNQVFASEKLALIHSEVSEGLEAIRKPGPDHHCPEFTSLEIEWADSVIRLLTFMKHMKIRPSALLAKRAYNKTRPFKHSKGF